MIRIKRKRTPKVLTSGEVQAIKHEYEAFHLSGGIRSNKERFDLDRRLEPLLPSLMKALDSQFEGLCAYSEVRLDASSEMKTLRPGRLVRHRPMNDATSLDGRVDFEHYWWLALSWPNLYLASNHIHSVKSYMFPVVGDRSAVESNRIDEGILIDPCRDEPAWWLRFERNGTVSPRVPPGRRAAERFGKLDRGKITIDRLGLNSKQLVKQRRRACEQSSSRSEAPVSISQLLKSGRAHRGATLQAVLRERFQRLTGQPPLTGSDFHMLQNRAPAVLAAELLDAALPQRSALFWDLRWDEVAEYIESQFPDAVEDKRFIERFSTENRPQTTHNVSTPPPQDPRPAQAVGPTDLIQRIIIKNYRAIQLLELEIDVTHPVKLEPEPDYHRAPSDKPRSSGKSSTGRLEIEAVRWKMLLGENGSGKSSILEAIALTLSGEFPHEVAARAGIDWSGVLRRGSDQPQGRVLVEFASGQSIDMRFTSDKSWFHGLRGGQPSIHTNVRAYGATRLLEKDAPTHVQISDTSIKVDNLLNPNRTVVNAEQWLLSLDEAAFNVAVLTLSDLFGELSYNDPMFQQSTGPDSTAKRIVRSEAKPKLTDDGKYAGRVEVDGDPLSVVSDGYRSVIALGCDIMSGIGGLHRDRGGISDLSKARGIVLIDEIGAHLHPRWRMQITDRLRRSMPNVQFIVTTHEPLCLRGLHEREVIRVVKFPEHGVVLHEFDRSPARYRVDQLLTSEFFGLESAVDPEVDRRFRRYYELRRTGPSNSHEEREFRELRETLNKRLRPVLGYTRRDQMIFEAIDDFLELEGHYDSLTDRMEERQRTIDSVRDLWSQVRRGAHR